MFYRVLNTPLPLVSFLKCEETHVKKYLTEVSYLNSSTLLTPGIHE